MLYVWTFPYFIITCTDIDIIKKFVFLLKISYKLILLYNGKYRKSKNKNDYEYKKVKFDKWLIILMNIIIWLMRVIHWVL